MKKIAFTIVLILLIAGGLTGCLGKTQEQTDASAQQEEGGYSSSSSSSSGYVFNIPETSKEETLNIPGNIGPGQRIFINESEAAVDGFGNFNAQLKLTPGLNSVALKVVSSDNKSIYATAKSVNYIPSDNPKLDVTIPGEYNSDTEMLIIKGATEPGCQVDANGYRATPDEKGDFIVSVPLENGENVVKVTSTNQKGKTSTVQQVVTYSRLNNKQPTLVVSSPEPKDGYVSTEKIKISGFTEPNNLIEIYNNYYNGDSAVKSLIFKGTTSNGQFSADVTLSKEGGGVNNLLIVATNAFGGTISETRNVIYKAS
ncbi:hypothetical protein L9W92_11280 [Pelotomaculum terephthalicicum JT]|uniref:hypothetical protein n=1 Tax=Pelotomaculum TaxID=191373 RepID=UPI0009CC4377|nr:MULTISPECIES: hypothetical protein [Pelotomaculum]MCG9968631.1 hypothetical protein [Pelotomaculum terephthalicicum JT]OPX85255.1 MAG: hypothetical protein A4E54_02513 [Pelotomaculum sp. PtaB.Bin117]OPY62592.1 MAG: hypothetical protein A4E56_01232 [Pelotomaculum sp. PtaU1.Bin065]